MALDPSVLFNMTTDQLRTLRQSYVDNVKTIKKSRTSRHNVTFPTDIRRCGDAIRLIDDIIRFRTKPQKPLAEFEP